MKIFEKIHPSWDTLRYEMSTDAFLAFRNEILPNIVYYPEMSNIFRVFSMPVSKIKVVILGQDPYYNPGQANGLAFAVHQGTPTPPSLKNILEEINLEISKFKGFNNHTHFKDNITPQNWKALGHWEEQGVFLLNTALTVESGKPGSHIQYWEEFIKKVIYLIGSQNPCIWLLWGQQAHKLMVNLPRKSVFLVEGYTESTIGLIPNSEDYNYVLRAAHPAAESYRQNAGFFGCNHFWFANTILSKRGQKQINW